MNQIINPVRKKNGVKNNNFDFLFFFLIYFFDLLFFLMIKSLYKNNN